MNARTLLLFGCLAMLSNACATLPQEKPERVDGAQAALCRDDTSRWAVNAVAMQLADGSPGWRASAGLALLLEQCGHTASALTWHERALALKPGDPELANNYALALADAGRREEAIALLADAVTWSDLAPAVADELSRNLEFLKSDTSSESVPTVVRHGQSRPIDAPRAEASSLADTRAAWDLSAVTQGPSTKPASTADGADPEAEAVAEATQAHNETKQSVPVPIPPSPASGPPSPQMTTTPPLGTDWRIQLASFRKAENARRELDRLQAAFPQRLAGAEVRGVDLADNGRWYRVLSAPMAQDGANAGCQALQDAGERCRVLKDR